MIFVSFGNAPAEHSFSRLAEAVDDYAAASGEEVLVQSGNSRYSFKNCMQVSFLEHDQMLEKMKAADCVVLHGGWGTISEALTLGKKIIAVPRMVGEENYHDQSEIVRALEYLGCVMGVYDITDLPRCIENSKSFPFKPLQRGSAAEIINKSILNWFSK